MIYIHYKNKQTYIRYKVTLGCGTDIVAIGSPVSVNIRLFYCHKYEHTIFIDV